MSSPMCAAYPPNGNPFHFLPSDDENHACAHTVCTVLRQPPAGHRQARGYCHNGEPAEETQTIARLAALYLQAQIQQTRESFHWSRQPTRPTRLRRIDTSSDQQSGQSYLRAIATTACSRNPTWQSLRVDYQHHPAARQPGARWSTG